MKIKVCGMRDAENISELIKLDIDFIGFIFYKKSLRYVSDFPDVQIPKDIKKVGVFVNESVDNVIKMANKYGLDAVQLHGNTETTGYCHKIKNHWEDEYALDNKNLKVIKVFSMDDDFNFELTTDFAAHCDYFLFDTKGKNYGGTGIKFNWKLLSNYKGVTPYLLSGGISLIDVDEINDFFKTPASKNCIGVDLNSGFEDDIALKNIEEIEDFKNNLDV